MYLMIALNFVLAVALARLVVPVWFYPVGCSVVALAR